jgi:hypothetical protein
MFGVWSAAAFMLVWLIGFGIIAGWIPPLAPATGAPDVANMFASHSTRILAGMVCMTLGAVLYLPWTMLLSDLIKEIEGKSFFLSGTQLAAGVISTVSFFLPGFLWAVAAFRPDRNPDVTQALVDLGWIMFITAIGPFILQYAILAVAIFIDRRPVPVFPRWAAYVQIWVSVSFLPGVVAFFMKTGPFAWNGLFVWWIPFGTFTGWFVVMIVLSRQAVLRELQPRRREMAEAGRNKYRQT